MGHLRRGFSSGTGSGGGRRVRSRVRVDRVERANGETAGSAARAAALTKAATDPKAALFSFCVCYSATRASAPAEVKRRTSGPRPPFFGDLSESAAVHVPVVARGFAQRMRWSRSSTSPRVCQRVFREVWESLPGSRLSRSKTAEMECRLPGHKPIGPAVDRYGGPPSRIAGYLVCSPSPRLPRLRRRASGAVRQSLDLFYVRLRDPDIAIARTRAVSEKRAEASPKACRPIHRVALIVAGSAVSSRTQGGDDLPDGAAIFSTWGRSSSATRRSS